MTMVSHTQLEPAMPEIRSVSMPDLRWSIERALQDYRRSWPVSVPLALAFSLLGILLLRDFQSAQLTHLMLPLVEGFCLVAPVGAVGFYQFSRLREAGKSVTPISLFNIGWRAFRQIAALSAILFSLFLMWLLIAHMIYSWSVGGDLAASEAMFWQQMQTTAALRMGLVGSLLGLALAAFVFCISVVSFPLLLEHDVGAGAAMALSLQAALASPVVMAYWAAFIGFSLLIACAPMLLGLAIAFPILGHATWHLYRKAVG